MNFNNLENMIDVDFLRLALNAVNNAYDLGIKNVEAQDFKAVKSYAETNYRTHELALQMAIVIQQARDGLNPFCEQVAKNLLKELL